MFQKILHIGYKNFLKSVLIFGLLSIAIFGLSFYGVIQSIKLGILLALISSFCGVISFICYCICLFSSYKEDNNNKINIVIGFIFALALFFFMLWDLIGVISGYGL
jgi:hypothetical protein